jgi:hypothetical protein
MDGEVWHLVEGRRDDGAPAIFRIRELAPRLDLPRIFVVEMPYPITEMSRLPDAAAYRRLAVFEEQWLVPACAATGYEPVGLKIEEGSFFLYMYGAADPNDVIARLAPFDAALGFYDDQDPSWGEYATLKDLLDQAKAMPIEAAPPADETTLRNRGATIGPATKAAVRAAAKAAVEKPAGKQTTAKPAAAKQTTKLKKPAAKVARAGANASATKTAEVKTSEASTARAKPTAKKSAAKKSAAKNSAAKKSAAKTPTAKRSSAQTPAAKRSSAQPAKAGARAKPKKRR